MLQRDFGGCGLLDRRELTQNRMGPGLAGRRPDTESDRSRPRAACRVPRVSTAGVPLEADATVVHDRHYFKVLFDDFSQRRAITPDCQHRLAMFCPPKYEVRFFIRVIQMSIFCYFIT